MNVYVFLARDSAEFLRYPGADDGYGGDDGYRLSYRYMMLDIDSAILILNEFDEKDQLIKQVNNIDGKYLCNNADELLKFTEVLSSMVRKTLGMEGRECDVTVFLHVGGIPIDCSQRLIVAIERRFAALRGWSTSKDLRLLNAYESKQLQRKKITESQLGKLNMYAISSTAPNLLDLEAAKILLPRNASEMKSFLQRFENAGKTQNIQNAFVEKWNRGPSDGAGSNGGESGKAQ